MKKTLLRTLPLFLLPLAPFASAEPYIGAGYLYSNYDDIDVSGSNNGYTIYGGYTFAKLFSAELAYADFVDTNSPIDNSSVYSNAWLASGKITLPITIFDVYGRLGMGRFSNSINTSTDVYGGIGAGVSLGPARVALEYTKYDTAIVKDSVNLMVEFHF